VGAELLDLGRHCGEYALQEAEHWRLEECDPLQCFQCTTGKEQSLQQSKFVVPNTRKKKKKYFEFIVSSVPTGGEEVDAQNTLH
jgi:hypothetical protein